MPKYHSIDYRWLSFQIPAFWSAVEFKNTNWKKFISDEFFLPLSLEFTVKERKFWRCDYDGDDGVLDECTLEMSDGVSAISLWIIMIKTQRWLYWYCHCHTYCSMRSFGLVILDSVMSYANCCTGTVRVIDDPVVIRVNATWQQFSDR